MLWKRYRNAASTTLLPGDVQRGMSEKLCLLLYHTAHLDLCMHRKVDSMQTLNVSTDIRSVLLFWLGWHNARAYIAKRAVATNHDKTILV